MINRNKTGILSVLIAVLFAVFLSGCSQTTETDTITNNANQTATLNNENTSTVSSNTSNTMTPSEDRTATNTSNSSIPQTDNDLSATTGKQNSTDKAAPPVKSPTPIQSTGATDFFIFTQIRGALNADKELGDAVTVELKEGNIVLTGNVASEELKKKAEEVVRNVKGVKNIKNNIRVSS